MNNQFIVWKVDKKQVLGFVAAVLLPWLAGILGTVLTDFSAYSGLKMPLLAPAPVVFPIAWGAVYIFSGVSSFLIWRDTVKYTNNRLDKSLLYYLACVLMTFMWPFLFFNAGLRLLSAVWLAMLIAATVIVFLKFYKINKTAAYMLIPALLWMLFSLYLNIGFVILNG